MNGYAYCSVSTTTKHSSTIIFFKIYTLYTIYKPIDKKVQLCGNNTYAHHTRNLLTLDTQLSTYSRVCRVAQCGRIRRPSRKYAPFCIYTPTPCSGVCTRGRNTLHMRTYAYLHIRGGIAADHPICGRYTMQIYVSQCYTLMCHGCCQARRIRCISLS